MTRRDHTADAGERVNVGISSDNGSRIQHAVAADLNLIAEHRTEFFQSGFDLLIGAFDNEPAPMCAL